MKAGLVHAAMAPVLLLSACHPRASGPVPAVSLLASCGDPAQLQSVLAGAVAHGRAPETSPMGTCVANAARGGSPPAAWLLADAYRQAMSARPPAGRQAELELDLFGRRVGWLRMAAARGDPAAQFVLAQAMDIAAYRPMSDMALAWYQTAAENGNQPALAAIASAYRQGRIANERLYDFRKWLGGQTNPAAATRETARLLARPTASSLPQ